MGKAGDKKGQNRKHPCDLTAGEGLIKSLSEIRDSLKAGERPEERFTMRTVDLDLEPFDYTAEDVKETRDKLRASQAVFAKLLGVSVKTVQSWEQGMAPPTMACRLLDLINEDPERWISKLRDAVRVHEEDGQPA